MGVNKKNFDESFKTEIGFVALMCIFFFARPWKKEEKFFATFTHVIE